MNLFPDKPRGFLVTTHNLANLAANAAVAIKQRRDGNIRAALTYEKIADDIYSRLPAYGKTIGDALATYDEHALGESVAKRVRDAKVPGINSFN